MSATERDWHRLVKTCHKFLKTLACDLIALSERLESAGTCEVCLERNLLELIRKVSSITIATDPLVFLNSPCNHENRRTNPDSSQSFPSLPEFVRLSTVINEEVVIKKEKCIEHYSRILTQVLS